MGEFYARSGLATRGGRGAEEVVLMLVPVQKEKEKANERVGAKLVGVSCRATGDVVVNLGEEGAGFGCSIQNQNVIGSWSRVSWGDFVWFCNMGRKSWCYCWECLLEEMPVGRWKRWS